ncbi:amidohydrolase family protein [Alcaligenaceae bacterium]|nr:amidohydrolase family protein [Alcaligenaceae bacterium]
MPRRAAASSYPSYRHLHSTACGCKCHSAVARHVHRRVSAEISRRMFLGGMAAMAAPFLGFGSGSVFAAQPKKSERPVVFTNLRLFDGITNEIKQGLNVRVEGDRIIALPPAGENPGEAEIVDCGGRLLMPGLIDAHWHSTLCGLTQAAAMTADVPYIHLVAAREAQNTLMRGFTTVRDAGGPSFALKRAIDEGIVHGPRIYPSGAMVSQTSGHGDFRMRYEVPRADGVLSHAERAGVASIADGASEVLRRVREQLMLGASQIKMMAGGGVTSPYDPLDSVQFTEAELRAGVDAASDWGTYVMVHVYTAAGIQRAIRAGVKSIEHGQLADEETARLMADQGVWWSLQPFLADEDANKLADPRNRAKQLQVAEGTVKAYEMAQRLNVRTAWGTDILFTPQNLPQQGRMLAKLTRFYPPLDLLGIATGQNGELLGMSGLRNPYEGKVGVIAPGAMADILIADGDPTVNLDFLADPESNLRLIMKNGEVYKSTL